ncbi:MAG: hypothetical protein Tsb0010_09750 [Parvularculaceae bacterium]
MRTKAAAGETGRIAVAAGASRQARKMRAKRNPTRTRDSRAPRTGARRLRFRTPLAPRRGAYRYSTSDFLFTLGERISRLARWPGFRIEADWGALRRAADDRLTITSLTHVKRSLRGPIALSGVIELDRLDAALETIIDIGAACNAGALTSYGYGRYEIL